MTNPYGPYSGQMPQQPAPPQSGPLPQQPYGQQPGFPGYGGMPPGQHPAGPLADWGIRLLGWLLDVVVPMIVLYFVYLIGTLVMVGVAAASGAADATIGILVFVVMLVVGLGFSALSIWNLCYRRGTTGQTLGQKVVKIKTVGERTGQPIGFGNAFLRNLCHILDALPCYVGFFAPLWDDKQQTWADKLMSTVVVKVPEQSPWHPQQPGYPQQAGYPQQPGYPQLPGYPQQAGYPQQPPHGQQPGYPQQW